MSSKFKSALNVHDENLNTFTSTALSTKYLGKVVITRVAQSSANFMAFAGFSSYVALCYINLSELTIKAMQTDLSKAHLQIVLDPIIVELLSITVLIVIHISSVLKIFFILRCQSLYPESLTDVRIVVEMAHITDCQYFVTLHQGLVDFDSGHNSLNARWP